MTVLCVSAFPHHYFCMPPFSLRPLDASFGLFRDMCHSYLFGSDGYASPCGFCSFPSLPSLVTYSGYEPCEAECQKSTVLASLLSIRTLAL